MPLVEALEERMLLNNRFVVAGAADNVTTFATLHDALTPGLTAGDVIQIEPNSNPGHIVSGDIPAVKNLTIQGDPGSNVQSIPFFFLDNPVFITASQGGFTLKNVQVDIQNGTLEFLADGAITGCRIKNDFAGIALALVGTSSAVISNSSIENANPNNQSNSLVAVEPADGSHNRITDNQFVALTGSQIVLLNYSGGAGTTDVVGRNSFLSNTGLSPQFLVQNDNQGLTLQGNTFTDYSPSGTAIEVHPTVENLRIVDNVVSFPTGGFLSDGILVDVGKPTGPSSMVIADNHINTAGNGSGIEFTAGAPGFALVAKVEGNDLQGNGTGVQIDAGLGGSVAGIDLGGGAQGSLGGNDFRGDGNGGLFSLKTAIWVGASVAAGPIQARGNIYGVADPTTVIHDNNNDPTVAAVVSAGPLTGNAAYVETLYLDFLHRTGNVYTPNDAGGWVNLLNLGMPAATVATAIARSSEALGFQVDALYHRLLGRDADPAGRAFVVGYLQAGGTLEGANQIMMGSPEYQSRFPSDSAFVQSLYQNLLHRTASDAELSGWLAVLPQRGRAVVVQEFLLSQEFRDWEVNDDYATLLNRTPSAAEVNATVGSGLDLLTIDTLFAASAEFQLNG
jgi:hypothetical protein